MSKYLRIAVLKKLAVVMVILLPLLQALDWCFPLPSPGRDSPYAMIVVARDGTPLRAFPGDDHVWRHRVSLNEVSPLYLDALVTYEDRMFRSEERRVGEDDRSVVR